MMRIPANLIAIEFIALVAVMPPALAATESVLYSFPDSGTGYPLGNLSYKNGSLYGTGSGDEKSADGQAFELTDKNGSWKETSLITFDGTNGSTPYTGPVRGPRGMLYGTTSGGGKYGGGSVFALVKRGTKWVHHTIWAFGGPADGTSPTCDLVSDKSGNLYGTTFQGGAYNGGIAFELSNAGGVWSETILHSFGATGDGWDVYSGLLMAGSQTFYGTTQYGGGQGGYGTVFSLFESGGAWKEKPLYTFTGGADGGEPWGTPIMDKNGALYGTTYAGGVGKRHGDVGVVFRLSPSGGKWTETVLHSFGSSERDGENPTAGLTWGSTGELYGTTSSGGGSGAGGGTAFALRPSLGVWKETILHRFGSNGDGGPPQGGIVLDKQGNLYGTGVGGGKYNYGTVWQIKP